MTGFMEIQHPLNREALLALALWQNDQRSADVKRHLLQSLLEVTLYNAGSPLDRAELLERTTAIAGLGPVVLRREFEAALDACITEGRVFSSGTPPRVSLQASRLKEVSQVQQLHKTAVDSFSAELFKSIFEYIEPCPDDMALRALLELVKASVANHALSKDCCSTRGCACS